MTLLRLVVWRGYSYAANRPLLSCLLITTPATHAVVLPTTTNTVNGYYHVSLLSNHTPKVRPAMSAQMHSPVKSTGDQSSDAGFPRLRDLRHMQAQAELDQRRAKTAAEKVSVTTSPIPTIYNAIPPSPL